MSVGGQPVATPGVGGPPPHAQRWRAQGRNKIIAGIAIFVFGLLTLTLALPIFWWGGLLFGGFLIYSGYRDLRRAGSAVGPAGGGLPPPPTGTAYGIRAVRCARCGTENIAGSRFCGRCGQAMRP